MPDPILKFDAPAAMGRPQTIKAPKIIASVKGIPRKPDCFLFVILIPPPELKRNRLAC